MKEEKIGGKCGENCVWSIDGRWAAERGDGSGSKRGRGSVAQPKLGYASFGSAHLKQFYCCKTQTQLPVHAIYNELRARGGEKRVAGGVLEGGGGVGLGGRP